ncbi:MAG: metalloregulator ArsR/SmtB family transcription factor [Actinobacteria bacterium]|nr:metalloregulator ArsR/SmtB family transcription factor [Actinomycetota bacterium]
MPVSTPDPFDALADANRRALLQVLATGEMTVGELAKAVPISRPAVSRHLRLLEGAGLVSHRPEGTKRFYRLDDRGVEEMRRYMEQVWGEATRRYRLVVENTPES